MRGQLVSIAAVCCVLAIARADAATPRAAAWDAAAASRYLDARLEWWRQWPRAQRDMGTVCVSCHTSLPHVLAMPTLRAQGAAGRPGRAELGMLDDVVKRVWLWDRAEPFYPDRTRGVPKSAESRGVEGVLNALILATRDAEHGRLGADTRQALTNMWGQQMQAGPQKGAFTWLNFHLEPFESLSAPYWGATLAALAVAKAPEGYAHEVQIAPQVEALRGYLRSGIEGQSLYTRSLVLWADSRLSGVLEPARRKAIIDELIAAQEVDGGWSLTRLAPWKRIDGSALPATSDGYATAVCALILREAGVPAGDPALRSARKWLALHQDKDTGAVPAVSINKDRKVGTDAYLFMADEATGMAAMALRP